MQGMRTHVSSIYARYEDTCVMRTHVYRGMRTHVTHMSSFLYICVSVYLSSYLTICVLISIYVSVLIPLYLCVDTSINAVFKTRADTLTRAAQLLSKLNL